MAEISKAMSDLINRQIQAELESSYLYQSMVSFYEEKGLHGFSHWFSVQAKEEVEHAEKFIHYLYAQEKKVVLYDIHAPKVTFQSLRDPLEEQLKHEQLVTSLIYQLMDLARQEKDYRTEQLLSWFVSEQTEEEEHSKALLEAFDFAGDDKIGVFQLDQKLAERK